MVLDKDRRLYEGYHPWRFIIGLFLFTALCSIGFLRFHQINNARITYTDSESPSHVEARVLQTFLQQNGTLNMIEIMIESRDNRSLLRDDHRQQMWDLIHEINNEITVKNSSGHRLTYNDMCEPYCQKNDAFIALLKLYNKNFSRIEVTYPTMDLLGRQIFIASNIYGVSLVNDTNTIESFTTVILRYYMVYPEMKPLLDWEAKMVSLLYDSNKYSLLRCSAGSDNLVAKEVKEMGTKTAPLLSIALGMLMVFLMYKRRESKPVEAFLGGMTPILAGITTVGLVSATGLAFQSIVVSTLFLVLAIGIDDVFIMLAAWHRTEKGLDIPKRTAEMVQVSGSSMTVTSITNVISFGNGVLSSTPALQTFAIYSVAASVICYLYQLILFPAILTLTAHKEYKSIDDNSK
ncbi:patched family protein [Cooperia oncophora]